MAPTALSHERGYAAFTVGFHTCPIDIFSSFLRPP
jgi:hypothetical protein